MYRVSGLKNKPRPITNEYIRNAMESFTRVSDFWLAKTEVDEDRNLIYFIYRSLHCQVRWAVSHQQMSPSAKPVQLISLESNKHFQVPQASFRIFLYRRLVAEARSLYPGARWENKDQMAVQGWLSIIKSANTAWTEHFAQKEVIREQSNVPQGDVRR